MGIAVFWILNGLAKKIILGDYLAVNFIDRVIDNPMLFSGFENFMALMLYSLQVYADFSGYTDIAIGVAMLMGFYLPKNFDSPYKATNPANFWKRWHISLSTWLKDYLYIPLGGNRKATFGTWFWIILLSALAVMLSGSWWVTLIILGIVGSILLWSLLQPSKRNKIVTNLNLMVTMLLGGFWHGASWNFMIWGGLNGVGIVVYKVWRQLSALVRLLVCIAITAAMAALSIWTPAPLWNLLFLWIFIFTCGTLVQYLFTLLNIKYSFSHLSKGWAVTQTFLFISFTRLFFRSGSNLDPVEANEVAWNTARQMVHQMGSTWNLSIIPDICVQYHKVFILFIIGMIIHWLPTRWKRWYRINIALLPLPVLALLVLIVVFVVYQFITAELQPFIYFQF